VFLLAMIALVEVVLTLAASAELTVEQLGDDASVSREGNNAVIQITRRPSENNAEWTSERIAAHQDWMATQGTAIWRIPQLS